MFNRLLTLLLQDLLADKAQVRYNDFFVRIVRAGKEGTGQRVMRALQEIRKMEKNKISATLPLPQTEGWKFARALPAPLLADMSLSDHYHVEEFMDNMRNVPVFILNLRYRTNTLRKNKMNNAPAFFDTSDYYTGTCGD